MNLRRRAFLGSAVGTAAFAVMPRRGFGREVPSFPLYDTHAHFFTDDTAHYPFNSGAPPEIADRMIARMTAHPMTPDTVFPLWDDNGIAMGCGVQYNTAYSTDNRYLLDIARAHPDRIVPIVILDPVDATTPARLESMAREKGIAGVRFTGRADSAGEFAFLGQAAAPSWEAADRLGLVIVLMPVGQGQELGPAMARIAEHARRYPGVRIVLDHIGFPAPQALPESFGFTPEHLALASEPNVYFKYTTLLIDMLEKAGTPAGPFLEYVVKTYGADRLVWGSDIGNTPGTMHGFVQRALASAAGLPEDRQRALFFDTAKRIFVPGGTAAHAGEGKAS